jgi:hypothetical protein
MAFDTTGQRPIATLRQQAADLRAQLVTAHQAIVDREAQIAEREKRLTAAGVAVDGHKGLLRRALAFIPANQTALREAITKATT